VIGGVFQEKKVGFVMPEENRTSPKAIGKKLQPRNFRYTLASIVN
jgi:hypothetical protein